MKDSKTPNFETIIRFLNFWDPLNIVEDLIESHLVPDEYDGYAERIFRLLEKGITATSLLEEFKTIQEKEMGRPFDFKKANLIAEALVPCFVDQNHLFYLKI